jgi:hypothetical protein
MLRWSARSKPAKGHVFEIHASASIWAFGFGSIDAFAAGPIDASAVDPIDVSKVDPIVPVTRHFAHHSVLPDSFSGWSAGAAFSWSGGFRSF